MRVNCTQAAETTRHGAVQCRLGLFGGFPSAGVCSRCPKREAVEPGKPAVLPSPVIPREPPPSPKGPGTAIKRVLDELGIKPKSGCGCAAFQRKMDAWGWGGCLANRAEIVSWFTARAKENGVKVTPLLILRALRAAWKTLR